MNPLESYLTQLRDIRCTGAAVAHPQKTAKQHGERFCEYAGNHCVRRN